MEQIWTTREWRGRPWRRLRRRILFRTRVRWREGRGLQVLQHLKYSGREEVEDWSLQGNEPVSYKLGRSTQEQEGGVSHLSLWGEVCLYDHGDSQVVEE